MRPDIVRRPIAAREVRSLPACDTSGPRLVGYAAVFDTLSELMTARDDAGELVKFYEEIAPGAFAASLASGDVVALKNHNEDMVLGRTSAGTLDLSEDVRGLAFDNLPPACSYALDLFISLDRGDLRGCSFGFLPEQEEVREGPDGIPIVRLTRVRLLEVSFGVTWPAYLPTSVALRSMRSLSDWRAARRRSAAPPARPRLEAARRALRLS